VKGLKGQWGAIGRGYKERWPDTWEAELEAKVSQKLVCITKVSAHLMRKMFLKPASVSRYSLPYVKIMDHVIEASIATFAGTPRADSFLIFHDGLSAWWEADAQAHLASRGFANRQIRNTTANKGTRYERKIVGDSPEMCRALDSHGFADLKSGLLTYSSFTSLYPKDDTRRFNLGTPSQLFSSIERTWRVTPTSERIIEDVELLPVVLDKIKARGCVVQDEEFRGLRTGRRAVGSSQLAPKVRRHQRVAELSSCVPDIPEIAEAKELIRAGSKRGVRV